MGVMKREFMEVLTFGRNFEDVRGPWMQEDRCASRWLTMGAWFGSNAQCSLPGVLHREGLIQQKLYRENLTFPDKP